MCVVCVCVHECRHTHSCLTLCDPMDCGPPGSFAHGIFQARMLEWIVISFSRESFWSRNQIYISCLSCISRWVLYQLSHQGSPIRGMCTLLIFPTKDSTLMMVGVIDPNVSFYVFVGICGAANGHNCIPVILQWGVSLLVHYYQALLDVMLTLISEVQILTFFLQMLGLPCVLFGWPHSIEQWINSLRGHVSIMWHTGFLCTESRLWEIKVLFGTYWSSLHT